MNTIKINSSATWTDQAGTMKPVTFWEKYNRFADSQAKNRTAWFFVSLLTQGVLFLPIPALLIYYFSAPVIIVTVTLALFFANVIAGMGGSSIRSMISLFAISTAVHIVMLIAFII